MRYIKDYFIWLARVIGMMFLMLGAFVLFVAVPGFIIATVIGIPLRWLIYG